MVDCNNCYKHDKQLISEDCIFCQKCSFQEDVLCDLLRIEQDKEELECFAFKPNLKLIYEKDEALERTAKDYNKEIKISDRQNWLKAYMFQQLKINPEQVYCKLRYHLCLVTNKREKSLKQVIDYLPDPSILLNNIGDSFKGIADLLFVNSDHVHIYIESSPDYSIDDVVNKIIPFFELNLQKQFPQIVHDMDY